MFFYWTFKKGKINRLQEQEENKNRREVCEQGWIREVKIGCTLTQMNLMETWTLDNSILVSVILSPPSKDLLCLVIPRIAHCVWFYYFLYFLKLMEHTSTSKSRGIHHKSSVYYLHYCWYSTILASLVTIPGSGYRDLKFLGADSHSCCFTLHWKLYSQDHSLMNLAEPKWHAEKVIWCWAQNFSHWMAWLNLQENKIVIVVSGKPFFKVYLLPQR